MSQIDTHGRRSFSHFIIMAGASCSGKSTLAERLANGQLPALATTLGLNSALPYHPLYGRDWEEIHIAPFDRVLLQYDLTDCNPFADQGILRSETLELLGQARCVTFLTVWEAPAELDRRLQERFRVRGGIAYTVAQQLRKRGVRRAWHSLQRFRQRRRLFHSPDALWRLYKAWFESCGQLEHGKHWVLRSTAPNSVKLLTAPPNGGPFWGT